MTAPSISNQQLPPPPYSKTDNLPTSNYQLSLNGSVQGQDQQVQAQVQGQAPELVSAAETLTLLTRNATPPSDADTVAMDDAQSPVILPPIHPQHQRHPIVSTVSMVARHPIMMNAVKYYETSKRNYPSFNYAAGIVESAAIPVVNNIEAKLNTRHQTRQASAVSSTDITPTNSNFGDYKIQHDGKNQLQKKRRFSASSQTSNISSYSSIDTKKRLQFCINILKLANTNISSKVEFLQEKINETEIAVKEEREKLIAQKSHDSNSTNTTEQATQKTKTEIVGTVKKIIHLISNLRPSSLGDTSVTNGLSPVSSNGSQSNQDFELKNAIKDIIMSLPQSLQQQQQLQQLGSPTNSQDDVIFKFAKESLVMISKLTQIFTEKLDQVEHWVNGDEEQEQKLQLQLQLPEGLEKQQEDEREEENLAAETKRMKLDGSV